MLKNQYNHFAGFNSCAGISASVSIRAAQQLTIRDRQVGLAGMLKNNGDPFRVPRMKAIGSRWENVVIWIAGIGSSLPIGPAYQTFARSILYRQCEHRMCLRMNSARSTRLNESINPLEISGSSARIFSLGLFKIRDAIYVSIFDMNSL